VYPPQQPMFLPPPPPPQVVYYPAYAAPPMMMAPQPRRLGPWSIRWPAGFMTTYGVLLYILTGLLLLLAVLVNVPDPPPKPSDLGGLTAADLSKYSLRWAGVVAVMATLLIHGAGRARRMAGGHLWYPLALCLVIGVVNLALIFEGGGMVVLIPAVVFLGSALMLLLPGSRRWLRRPPKPPSLESLERESGPPEAMAG
jgi:hypothetical protein